MEELNKYPDVNNYLMHVLSKLTSEGKHNLSNIYVMSSLCYITSILLDEVIRTQSGSILKRNVEEHFHSFPQEVTDFIQNECLSALGLARMSPLIRANVGLLVATIARDRLANWPDLLPELCQMLDSTEDSVCDGALGVLQNICEDSLRQVPYCALSTFFI